MFHLLKNKNYSPFFFTMGLGALNDNLFKSALGILIAYNYPAEKADLYIQLSAGLFILPFFLFSGISGQICDQFEKSYLMKRVKIIEIIVMSLGFFAFMFNHLPLQLTSIFLMGAQSTLFGPVKYSYLPISQKPKDLLAANSLTSMGTFVFILIGTILGGILVSKDILSIVGFFPISIAVILLSIFGYICSRYIPELERPKTNSIKLNPIKETIRTIGLSSLNKHVKRSIHGISWFWFFGFFFMASLPGFVRDTLKADEITSSIFLTAISIGMGIGSIFCNKLSEGELKIGLVPFASLGISLSGVIFSLTPTIELADKSLLFSPINLIQSGVIWIPLTSLFFVGFFGGAYIVPLYTMLQIKTPKKTRSQFIASNNIINAIYMVSAALCAIIGQRNGLALKDIFFIVSLLNIISGAIFFIKYPSDFYLIFFKIFFKTIYKIKINYKNELPKDGPVIIASNHISFIDPLLITSVMNRPPIFIMDQFYFNIKSLQWFYKSARAIPIVPKKVSEEGLKKAMKEIEVRLEQQELVVLFPEAYISKDGNMIPFKRGISELTKTNKNITIIPMAISGMWGSWFSRHKNGRAMNGMPKRRNLRTKITINIGQPISSQDFDTNKLYDEVKKLRGEIR
jgi:1-acyl-sn-glycerol-3-phosphate acyltransferase